MCRILLVVMSWCKINQQKFYLLCRHFDLIIIPEDSFCTLQPFHISISRHSKTTMMLLSTKCQQHHQNSVSDGSEFWPDKKKEKKKRAFHFLYLFCLDVCLLFVHNSYEELGFIKRNMLRKNNFQFIFIYFFKVFKNALIFWTPL